MGLWLMFVSGWAHRGLTTPSRRQSKTLKLSRNIDQKSLETEFLIAICRPTGDKWQSKTLFLAILIRVRRLLRAFSIAAYTVCLLEVFFRKQELFSLFHHNRILFDYFSVKMHCIILYSPM